MAIAPFERPGAGATIIPSMIKEELGETKVTLPDIRATVCQRQIFGSLTETGSTVDRRRAISAAGRDPCAYLRVDLQPIPRLRSSRRLRHGRGRSRTGRRVEPERRWYPFDHDRFEVLDLNRLADVIVHAS